MTAGQLELLADLDAMIARVGPRLPVVSSAEMLAVLIRARSELFMLTNELAIARAARGCPDDDA